MTERIFEIKTLKSVILKNLFEVIKPYIKETNILINKDCIKISTLDVSKVSLTYIKLDANKFESYKCEKPVILGIDTNTYSSLSEIIINYPLSVIIFIKCLNCCRYVGFD